MVEIELDRSEGHSARIRGAEVRVGRNQHGWHITVCDPESRDDANHFIVHSLPDDAIESHPGMTGDLWAAVLEVLAPATD